MTDTPEPFEPDMKDLERELKKLVRQLNKEQKKAA